MPTTVVDQGQHQADGEAASFAYLHVATGLGGGVVVEGRMLRGVRGNAGEFWRGSVTTDWLAKGLGFETGP